MKARFAAGGRHASGHARDAEHPVLTSAEQGETWAHCFLDGVTVAAPAAGDTGRRQRGR